MPVERKKKKSPEIPVSSFSDIAFLLIIFFILATTIDKITGFLGDLPAGQRSEDTQTDKAPSIQLHNDRLVLDDRDLDLPSLRKALQDLKLRERKEEKLRVVMLEAIGPIPYQRYFEVMSAISAAGGVVAIVKEDKK